MPEAAFRIFADLLDGGFSPVSSQNFFKEVLYAIRMLPAERIAQIPDVSEGLENRIKSAGESAKDYDDLVKRIKTKRYTQTRIQRILCYILLGITREMTDWADQNVPGHIKVLAYRKDAAHLLSHFTTHGDIRLFHSSVGMEQDAFISLDLRATDIYSLAQNSPKFFTCGRDYTQKTLTD
jgi:predicted nucleotidyltransferase